MKRSKRAEQLGKARAAKEAHFRAAKARGDVGGRSKYARKIQRKCESGKVSPDWMWWISAG